MANFKLPSYLPAEKLLYEGKPLDDLPVDRMRDILTDHIKKSMEMTLTPQTKTTQTKPKMDYYSPLSNDTAMQLLGMRMRFTPGHKIPLEHLSVHVNNEVAFVFVVDKNNKAVVIEDDANLYPSDSLITQLRLIIG